MSLLSPVKTMMTGRIAERSVTLRERGGSVNNQQEGGEISATGTAKRELTSVLLPIVGILLE